MEEEKCVFVNEIKYYEELRKFYSVHDRSNKKPWTSDKLNEIYRILSDRETIESGKKKTSEFYYYSRMYETLEIDKTRAIIKKRSKAGAKVIYIVPYESFYEKLYDIHMTTSHGGRDKMLLTLKSQYSIPRPAVEIFVKCCIKCAEKKQPIKKGIDIKPGFPKGWYFKGQVELIDLRATPDGEYTWLLFYEDQRTKFIMLRPLKSNRTEDVSLELMKIFLEFGVPKTLQSSSGRGFVDDIVENMTSRWPICKIINSQPNQSQTSVERTNQDIEEMLAAWLKEHNATNWSLGCYFVQKNKNSCYNRNIKCTPFRALFGLDVLEGRLPPEFPPETVQVKIEDTFSPTSDVYHDSLGNTDDLATDNHITTEIKIEPIE